MSQWSLVGDALLSLREQAADVPSALPAPTLSSVTPAPPGSLAIWFTVTQLTPWGESPASAESAVTTGAIGATFTLAGICSFAATSLRVYFTLGAAGGEDRYSEYAIPSGGIGAFSLAFTLSGTGTGQGAITPGFAPSRSSAWLPDTDGTALSAAALYRWMNRKASTSSQVLQMASATSQESLPLKVRLSINSFLIGAKSIISGMTVGR